MIDLELLGVCGLYCGACYHYRASFPEGRHLLEKAAEQGKDIKEFTCLGCRSDKLYMHPGCAQCRIRDCAEQKGVRHCGLCREFPCEIIGAFQSDGRVHHVPVFAQLEEMREKGPETWLRENKEKWTCSCGARFSWYEVHCRACGEPVNSFGPDPAAGG